MKPIFKFIFSILFTIAYFVSFSQAPGKFNYQAVIRDANGNGVLNQSVDIRFQIYDASAAGNLVYQEDFIGTNTGNYGVVNLQIGTNGNIPLTTLNWGMVHYYVNIQMKQGGGSFTDISPFRTQLVSVPYALYAGYADSASIAINSIHANTANVANSANTANVAANALHADSAYIAGAAIHCDTANFALNAISAWNDFAIYQEKVASGASSSTVWSTNTWIAQYLNSNQAQNGTSVSRNGNVITLRQGTYYVKTSLQVQSQGTNTYNYLTTRFRDATTNTTVLNGTIAESSIQNFNYTGTNFVMSIPSTIEGVVTVTSASENFQLEGYTGIVPGAYVSTQGGEPAIITSIFIQKVQ